MSPISLLYNNFKLFRPSETKKEELKRCLALSPGTTVQSRARLSLAVIYRGEGKHRDVEETLAPALDLPLEPFFRAEIHAHLAETFAHQGRIDKCMEHVRRTVVMDEEHRWRTFFQTKEAFHAIRDNEEFVALVGRKG